VVSLGASRDGRPRAVMLFSAFCETYDGIKNNRPEIAETCRRVRAAIEPLAREPGVEWLGIANNVWTAPEDVAEYKTNTHTPFPLALDADGALFHAFGVHKMPTIALIDPAGRLVRMVGPDDRDLAEAVHALAGRR
jgi:peroxiredoxin